jgi:hypothetical protein
MPRTVEPHLVNPRTKGNEMGSRMARTDSDDHQVPRQLKLDDWAEEMRAGKSSLAAATGRGARRSVVCGRPQSRPVARAPGEQGAPSSPHAAEKGRAATQATESAPIDHTVPHHPVATELLSMPDALLTRTHLRDLGLERRAVDAVFRALPVVALPGYSRPMVRVADYVALLERNTYRDDRVRPMTRAS